jgi:hypothetical protein
MNKEKKRKERKGKERKGKERKNTRLGTRPNLSVCWLLLLPYLCLFVRTYILAVTLLLTLNGWLLLVSKPPIVSV